MGKKNKNKNNMCCKALCANTQTQKFAEIFCIYEFNNVYSTGALCQLISSIAKALIDFL